MTRLEILKVGVQATIQDLGRAGHADVGVTTGGACDRRSLRLANRLVGNAEDAAGIETLLGGLSVRVQGQLVVAVTGAPTPLEIDGRAVESDQPLHVPDGATLTMGMPVAGLRSYLAVRGGIDAPRLYASAASSPTLGLGPAALAVGDELGIGDEVAQEVPWQSHPAHVGFSSPVEVDVVLGPRDDWFTKQALATFGKTAWQATDQLDRVGIRLAGPELERAREGELLSEGMVRGAIQVPPNGQPVVFLADHPTTGGYPVIGVVSDAHIDRLGQVRPGDEVRFRIAPRPW